MNRMLNKSRRNRINSNIDTQDVRTVCLVECLFL